MVKLHQDRCSGRFGASQTLSVAQDSRRAGNFVVHLVHPALRRGGVVGSAVGLGDRDFAAAEAGGDPLDRGGEPSGSSESRAVRGRDLVRRGIRGVSCRGPCPAEAFEERTVRRLPSLEAGKWTELDEFLRNFHKRRTPAIGCYKIPQKFFFPLQGLLWFASSPRTERPQVFRWRK